MRAIVMAGGDPPDAVWQDVLSADAIVVAADSGIEHADALGRTADLLVGDLDSIRPDRLDRAVAEATLIERYPADKDATDLELAIAAARRLGADAVTVVGAGGGRLDHFLANVLVLANPAWADLAVDALIGPARVCVVRDAVTLGGTRGSLVTLLAVDGPATGVTTTGLRWVLTDAELVAGSSRGVSNELVDPVATITVRAGVLLAIQPTGGRPG